MSYGYVVFSTQEMDVLKKSRRFKFDQLDDERGFKIYLRMEYRHELSFVEDGRAILSKDGMDFLESVAAIKQILFMCFLMKNKEGDTDVVKRMFREINNQSVEKVNVRLLKGFFVDKAYLLV